MLDDDFRASDAVLVERLRRGDSAALAALYRRHVGVVLSVSRQVTTEEGVAEDVAQEVFLYLWKESTRFDPARGSLRSFLAVLARRRALDRVRGDHAARRRDHVEFLRHANVWSPGPEEATYSSLLAGGVREAVATLPAPLRDAVCLAYFSGLTYREVARALGVPEGTTKSRLRRALTLLSDALRSDATLEGADRHLRAVASG